MIDYYIVEFEQKGSDRAGYGEHLLENLAKMLEIKGLERNQLNLCRIFYLRYPQICSTVSSKLSIIDNRSTEYQKWVKVLYDKIHSRTENNLVKSLDGTEYMEYGFQHTRFLDYGKRENTILTKSE